MSNLSALENTNLSFDPQHPVIESHSDEINVHLTCKCVRYGVTFKEWFQRGSWLAVYIDCHYCGATFKVANDWGETDAATVG